jgi:4-aminobutyrate aminotransferase
VESAIKLARHATGKPNIITVQGGFHGRTIGCLSLTSSKYVYGIGYGPFMPGVARVPFPYCLRCPASKGDSCSTNPDFVCCGDPLEQLRILLKQASHPKDTAAILVEPILGEGACAGGVVPVDVASPPFWRRWLCCTAHGLLERRSQDL